MTQLQACLLLSSLLFVIGLAGALTRRHAIVVLIGIELMLNAANLNFIAFWRFGPDPTNASGVLFVLFSIGIAAAEAGVGLALVIALYRHRRTAFLDEPALSFGKSATAGGTEDPVINTRSVP